MEHRAPISAEELASTFGEAATRTQPPKQVVSEGRVSQGESREGVREGVREKSKGGYPWPTWCDGKPHTITQGVDFEVPPKNMQIILHNTAGRKGLFVLTELLSPVMLLFQMFRTQEDRDAAKEAMKDVL